MRAWIWSARFIFFLFLFINPGKVEHACNRETGLLGSLDMQCTLLCDLQASGRSKMESPEKWQPRLSSGLYTCVHTHTHVHTCTCTHENMHINKNIFCRKLFLNEEFVLASISRRQDSKVTEKVWHAGSSRKLHAWLHFLYMYLYMYRHTYIHRYNLKHFLNLNIIWSYFPLPQVYPDPLLFSNLSSLSKLTPKAQCNNKMPKT